MKSIFTKLLIVSFLALEFSCGGNIPDCPTKMCVLSGEWRLTETYINGVLDISTDLSKYKLTLLMPEPTTATTSLFNRVNPSGVADIGTWELRNNSTVLALIPASGFVEPYIIKSFTPRKLVLIIERDINKTGADEFEFVLEPF
ncbi:hypothetical protein [Chryseolinea lacunae]|uniref:Lipocalin-like domain-containing protein n=1 Tax=Chryseolinea lacunae TaxID=2801331 RepID=A0ABS1KN93_9BACT|nr:hypothetical protein [Chryseolinea lacunae]MBL0740906.1 hypothetical protein [Chryseolinea lacunae]